MIALALSLLLAQTWYSPEEAAGIFRQGNDAYARGDYAAAQQSFEQLLAHGVDDGDVLYNAGTAALAANDLGHAVLYLERALARGRGDTSDIEANLALARSKQLDQVVGAGTERTFTQRLVAETDEHNASLALLVTLLAGCGLFTAFRFLPRGNRSWAATLGTVSLCLAVLAAILVGAHAWVAQNVREGVVMDPTVPSRELPTPSAKVSFELHAGLKVRVLESEGNFVKVRLPNGLEGWAERKGIADL